MKQNQPHNWIIPNWPVAANVHAISTTRQGGFSTDAFSSMNLGDHVNDDPKTVQRNRSYLHEILQLPSEPFWLQQVHDTAVVELDKNPIDNKADAAVTHQAGQVCVIMTADCMPVLFSDRQGQCIAAAHAGWRGLCEGVLENTLQYFDCPREDILVWLGPAIGSEVFEVGHEVREAFLEAAKSRGLNQDEMANAFHHSANTQPTENKWRADLYALARQRLQALGVKAIYSDESCTFSDTTRFYSYRRESKTGRMATLIWMD